MSHLPRREAERVLRERFGLESFRPGQWEAIRLLLAGRDVAAVFPTGAGKSLCYQLPALLLPGVTLVVSPLISLIRDQTLSLRRRGIPCASLDSLQTAEERAAAEAAIRSGEARLIYVSPERLSSPSFLSLLRSRPVSLAVIDEAHCVVQWGESFRPAYAGIGGFLSSLPVRPAVCAMTATTDRRTLRAIAASLGLRRCRVLRLSLIRPNLRFSLQTTLQPTDAIRKIAAAHPGQKGLIFCATRLRAERLAQALSEVPGLRAACYHAGLPREERARAQDRFLRGELDVLAATSAFGMGVDIPDIRYVIHDSIPADCISYAQETGRAGRDGLPSDCVQLLDPRSLEAVRKRFQRIRQQLPRGLGIQKALGRLRGRQELRKRRRAQKAALALFLDGGCIQAELSRRFGLRARPCGVCERCRRAAERGGFTRLAPVPDLSRCTGSDLRYWALCWQRRGLAEARGVPPSAILSDGDLWLAAQCGTLPAGAVIAEGAEPALARTLARFQEDLYR